MSKRKRDAYNSQAMAEAVKYFEMARRQTESYANAAAATKAVVSAQATKTPWFHDKTKSTTETNSMASSSHKFKFDPAKVAGIFGTSATAAEAEDSAKTSKEKESAKPHPLAAGQVWMTRGSRLAKIYASADIDEKNFLGESGGAPEHRTACGQTVNSWWYGHQAASVGTEWRVNGPTHPHEDDLMYLVQDANGTPTKDSYKTCDMPKATEPKRDNPYPAGSIDARVVELIDKHGVPEDKLRAIMAEIGVKSSTITIEIPSIKVKETHESQHEQFPTLLELIANGERVFLSGPPGSGKTTATEKAAEILKRPFFIQGPVADEFRLTGFIDAHGNFQETEVYRWSTTPDAVLMLDEVDGSFPQPLLFLNMALANGYIAFPGKGKVLIPKTNTVVANGNTWGGGADFDFVGRSKLDAAFVNRFPAKLTWDYDPVFEESLAISANGGKKAWIKVMWKIRENARANGIKVHVTPRDTFFYCRSRARGWTHERALATGLLATCKADQREKLLAGVTDA